jgi:hypothetical protein
MKIKYRIIQANPQDHCIVVRYFTELLTEESLANYFNPDGSIVLTEGGYPVRCRTDYNLSLALYPSPTKDDILKLVNTMAPKQMFEIMEGALTNVYNMSVVDTMIGLSGEVNDNK